MISPATTPTKSNGNGVKDAKKIKTMPDSLNLFLTELMASNSFFLIFSTALTPCSPIIYEVISPIAAPKPAIRAIIKRLIKVLCIPIRKGSAPIIKTTASIGSGRKIVAVPIIEPINKPKVPYACMKSCKNSGLSPKNKNRKIITNRTARAKEILKIKFLLNKNLLLFDDLFINMISYILILMEMQREIAFKLPLSELIGGEYIKGEKEFEPNYLITKSNFRASRVNVWGNVVRRFTSENDLSSITLDDFSGCMDVNVFKENLSLFDNIDVGDVVAVIGKVKKGNKGLFILAESARKISPDEELMKRLENIKSLQSLEKMERKIKEKDEGAKIEVEKHEL